MKQKIISNKVIATALGIVVGITPLAAFAQQKNLSYLVNLAVQYINVFVYLILAFAFLVFVWNIYNYFIKVDPENKKDAGMYVLYSVIGFFIILSFWGLVNILSNTLKLDTTKPSGVGGQTSSNTSGIFGGTQYGVGYQLSPASPTGSNTSGGVSPASPTGSNTSGGNYYPGGFGIAPPTQ